MKLTKKQIWSNCLTIPLIGNEEYSFHCSCGLQIAKGFERVVIGDRGPYIEFNDRHIIKSNLKKQNIFHIYFDEYGTCCEEKLFVYYQLQTVSYADYKIGFWYICPKIVFFNNKVCYDIEKEVVVKDLF